MKTRHFPARIPALVAAAAVMGMVLGPASAEAADRLDGWANRDPDIGSYGLGSAMTQAIGPGSQLDGWANRGLDVPGRPSSPGSGGAVGPWRLFPCLTHVTNACPVMDTSCRVGSTERRARSRGHVLRSAGGSWDAYAARPGPGDSPRSSAHHNSFSIQNR
jgi:hypothetical protein